MEETLIRISDRVACFDKFVVEANMRFENGQRSFADHSRRVTEIEAQLRPSVLRVAAYLAGVLFTIGTLVWGAAFAFSMRPTFGQVTDLIENRANPTITRKLDEHDKALAGHGSQLDRVEVKIQNILDTVVEIKADMREGARRR